MLSAKRSREFQSSGISTPSIETSRDPYLSFNPNIDVRILAIVLPSLVPALVYPYFELNIEQDEIHKASLISKKVNELNDFALFSNSLYFGVILIGGVY